MLNVVLYQPSNPYNAGGIARTCALLGARLHLIQPYGFVLNRRVNRVSMDYLSRVELLEHADWENFAQTVEAGATVYAFSDRGAQVYTQVQYQRNDYLIFGTEFSGLPENVLANFPSVAIPMPGAALAPRNDHREHSLNVAISVGIAAYEAARQITNNWI